MTGAKYVRFAMLLHLSTAHVVMNTPTPYGLTEPPLLQVGPLDREGGAYRFPCQYGSSASAYPPAEQVTHLVAGTPMLLNFTGSAVHGGGSCQLSITYDWPPPSDKARWKVIHSIIGGCPASAAGNLGYGAASTDGHGRYYPRYCDSSHDTECLKHYRVPVPRSLKNGDATLAWTWLNKLGNREFYMNCAPVTISNGSDDDAFTQSLPGLFTANIPGECTTGKGVVDFPDPGLSVERGEGANVDMSTEALGSCTSDSEDW